MRWLNCGNVERSGTAIWTARTLSALQRLVMRYLAE